MQPIWLLNFHGLGTPPPHVGAAEARYWLTATAFDDFLAAIDGLPHVELTFDDGNRSDLDLAVPALARRRRFATFFVCAGRVGEPSYLGAGDLRALVAAGMSVGSHGWAHRSWRGLLPPEQAREWSDARQAIADHLGQQIDAAACPFGEYDRAALRGLRAAGFRRIYTSDGGPTWSRRGLLARRTITCDDDPLAVGADVRRPPAPLARVRLRLREILKGWR
ncbi:MAG: polysaccharide deacetylase family protein [Phycisphaerales bacterium]